MANQGITISGLDDCLKLFDNAPENLRKVSKTALRDASREVTRFVRNRTPKRWRRLVKYKVVRLRSNRNLNAVFGMFNTKVAQGHQNPTGAKIDDWFKAYWLNYGTLENRDPGHKFDYPVKHRGTIAAKRRKNTEGIKPRNFFEQAIQGWEDKFVRAFSNSLNRQENALYDR